MLKFFSKRFAKQGRPTYLNDDPPRTGYGSEPPDSNSISCTVTLLDGDVVKHYVNKKATGHELFDKLCFNIELNERDYFGLQYRDKEKTLHWLDHDKQIRKQIYIGANNSVSFNFKVKFFPSHPNSVKEELTKYYLYWQLKQEISDGLLPVPTEIMYELAAFTVQSELGDMNDVAGGDASQLRGVVSEFRFIPDQSEAFEINVIAHWSNCTNLNPAQCEDRYLNIVKDVEMYGVSMHDVEGRDGNLYRLGLTPFGMLIYDQAIRIGLFFWQKTEKLAFNKKRLVIEVVESDAEGVDRLHSFQFTMKSSKACKHLWKCAIEYHTFYRLQAANVASVKPKQSFVRMGSRFRYSGRTEAQMRASARAPQPRRHVQFQRKPSRRYSRRQETSAYLRDPEIQPPRGNTLNYNSSDTSSGKAAVVANSRDPSNLSINLSNPHSQGNLDHRRQTSNLIEFSPTAAAPNGHHLPYPSSGYSDRRPSPSAIYTDQKDSAPPPRPPLPNGGAIDEAGRNESLLGNSGNSSVFDESATSNHVPRPLNIRIPSPPPRNKSASSLPSAHPYHDEYHQRFPAQNSPLSSAPAPPASHPRTQSNASAMNYEEVSYKLNNNGWTSQPAYLAPAPESKVRPRRSDPMPSKKIMITEI